MNHNDMVKQMIEFNKSSFENSYNMMVNLQDQAEQMTNTFLDQPIGIPDDGKKVILEWIDAFKKGRTNFKSTMDANYEKLESFLTMKQ
jgi:hypothetical protein